MKMEIYKRFINEIGIQSEFLIKLERNPIHLAGCPNATPLLITKKCRLKALEATRKHQNDSQL